MANIISVNRSLLESVTTEELDGLLEMLKKNKVIGPDDQLHATDEVADAEQHHFQSEDSVLENLPGPIIDGVNTNFMGLSGGFVCEITSLAAKGLCFMYAGNLQVICFAAVDAAKEECKRRVSS